MAIGYHNSNSNSNLSLFRQHMTQYTVKTTSESHLMKPRNKVTSSCNQQQENLLKGIFLCLWKWFLVLLKGVETNTFVKHLIEILERMEIFFFLFQILNSLKICLQWTFHHCSHNSCLICPGDKCSAYRLDGTFPLVQKCCLLHFSLRQTLWI